VGVRGPGVRPAGGAGRWGVFYRPEPGSAVEMS
jgi:hypothetical protein